MANPLLTRRRILALKSETTVGTAVSLAAADAGFKVEDRQMKVVRESGVRQAQGSGGNDLSIAEAAHTELTFTARVAGKGAVGVPAWAAVLFPALGFSLTSQTFSRSWDSSTWKSMSAGAYVDGIKLLGRGIMGNAKINLTPGMMGTIDFEGKGGYVANAIDAAILSGMTYETVQPPIWVPGSGTSLSIDGQTIFKPAQTVIDLGNNVDLREDPGAAGGYASAWITSGAAKITMSPETLLRATWDDMTKHSSNSTFTWTAVLDGGTNNIVTFSATMQLMQAPEFDDRNGRLVSSLVFGEVLDSLTVAFS